MSKYERLKRDLELYGEGSMKCFGNSMTPILYTGSLNFYKKFDTYEIGDIVFCKVKGNYIDAHKIIKKSSDGKYLIANKHGHENGWTNKIYGKVIKAIHEKSSSVKEF